MAIKRLSPGINNNDEMIMMVGLDSHKVKDRNAGVVPLSNIQLISTDEKFRGDKRLSELLRSFGTNTIKDTIVPNSLFSFKICSGMFCLDLSWQCKKPQ
ncbi:hypothetical protein Y032_0238g3282 [Ancylostoma ceylanicum]|nr:hypothetical protein Y032_0238g3282 [Ancylostoma ceylanicum]